MAKQYTFARRRGIFGDYQISRTTNEEVQITHARCPDNIIDRINTKKYDNLDDLLKSIKWELMGDELIEPINLCHFLKCIADNEINE
jgi:hypothetical protein